MRAARASEKLHDEVGRQLTPCSPLTTAGQDVLATPIRVLSDHAVMSAALNTGHEERALELLELIENKILRIIVSQQPSVSGMVPSEQLKEIYSAYSEIVKDKALFDIVLLSTRYLIVAGRIEEAVQKAEVLRLLDVLVNGRESFSTRFDIAIVKNLLGDHKEWMGIQYELRGQLDAVSARNAQRNKKKRERVRAEIQAKARAVEEGREHARAAAEALIAQRLQSQRAQPETAVTPEAFAALSISPSQDRDDSAQQRMERHLKNEARRQTPTDLLEKTSEDQPVRDEAATDGSNEPSRPSIDELEVPELTELVNLTGVPLKVHREIGDNTWRFKRDELEMYFQSQGCTVRKGKGVHENVELPESTTITLGNEIITVFNNFGGSLPLPKWDGKHVPLYLKSQILLAQKRLIAFKMQARQ